MLKIFTVRYSEKTENFPDQQMSDFLAGKEMLRWESHFFERKGEFFWTILVEYQPGISPEAKESRGTNEKKDSYKSILTETDWPLFKLLQEWRGEKSRGGGIPPYIICTNVQLARISVMRPDSLNALQSIDGIGKAKIEKYGKEILQIVASCGKPLNFESAESTESGGSGIDIGTDESSGIGIGTDENIGKVENVAAGVKEHE